MPIAPEALVELNDAVLPLEERLARRLDVLKTNREKFITNAQRELSALDAAIAELSALLDPASVPARDNGRAEDESAEATQRVSG